jgi:hypothetical protein
MNKELDELCQLFDEARNNFEFEFVQTLINNYGMAENRTNTNLFEWFDAIDFYSEQYAKLTYKEKVRIGLLLYSTFFESSDFYRILGNLCYNKLGLRGSPVLYWKTKRRDRLLGTGEKVENLTVLLEECKFHNLISFFTDNHFQELRNTFFHSAYAIHENHYFLIDSDPIVHNGNSFSVVDIEKFLFPKIENIIIFFKKFKELYYNHFNSYTEDKAVQGYFPDLKEVVILGSKNGLAGFVVKNATSFYGQWVDAVVKFDEEYQWWFTKNIEVTFPQLEDIINDERLNRYEKKDDIKITDLDFFKLADVIVERGRKDEMERLIALLVKFGDKKYSAMESEQNPHKKKSFINIVMQFYKKAVMLNRHLDLRYIAKRIMELEKQ